MYVIENDKFDFLRKICFLLLFLSHSEVNKQLRDENDSLRAMIDSRKLLLSPPEVNEIIQFNYHLQLSSSRCYHHQND